MPLPVLVDEPLAPTVLLSDRDGRNVGDDVREPAAGVAVADPDATRDGDKDGVAAGTHSSAVHLLVALGALGVPCTTPLREGVALALRVPLGLWVEPDDGDADPPEKEGRGRHMSKPSVAFHAR